MGDTYYAATLGTQSVYYDQHTKEGLAGVSWGVFIGGSSAVNIWEE